jgi:hypothetical protein
MQTKAVWRECKSKERHCKNYRSLYSAIIVKGPSRNKLTCRGKICDTGGYGEANKRAKVPANA